MVRLLVLWGLLIVAIGFLALIVIDTETGGANRDLAKKAVWFGAGLCGLGIGIGALARIANTSFRRRCPVCRRPVARGHIYCEDHFQQALDQARDSYKHR
jgi:hypothetical protein